jgi:glycosyltransferase involved in cell wall biosynthesis
VDIDVILPFHRLDAHFRDAVESLKATTGVSFRVIAVDDREDKSQSLKSFLEGLRDVVIVKTNGGTGYGSALSLGSKFILSDAVALFNSDDLMTQDRLKVQIKSLENFDLSFSKLQNISKKGTKIPSLLGNINSNRFDPLYLLLGSYGANASWVMRADWWNQNAFFDSHECLDWRIALNSFNSSKVKMELKPLYSYRKHPGQYTKSNNLLTVDMEPVYKAWEKFATDYDLAAPRFIFDVIATPWLHSSRTAWSDFYPWVQRFLRVASVNTPDAVLDLHRLLQRRSLFAAGSTNINLVNRLIYLSFGAREAPSLTGDLISSFLH